MTSNRHSSALRLARLVPALVITLALATTIAHGQQTDGGGTGTGTADGGGGGAVGGSSIDTQSSFGQAGFGETSGDASTLGRTQGNALGAAAGGGAGGGGAGGGGGGFGGGLGGLGALFGGAFGGAGAGGTTQPAVRVRLRNAIGTGPLPVPQVQRSVTQAINRLPRQSSLPGVNVVMNGRTAIVTGTASSERERRMSELLLRLEPGVSRIENNVRVIPQNQLQPQTYPVYPNSYPASPRF